MSEPQGDTNAVGLSTTGIIEDASRGLGHCSEQSGQSQQMRETNGAPSIRISNEQVNPAIPPTLEDRRRTSSSEVGGMVYTDETWLKIPQDSVHDLEIRVVAHDSAGDEELRTMTAKLDPCTALREISEYEGIDFHAIISRKTLNGLLASEKARYRGFPETNRILRFKRWFWPVARKLRKIANWLEDSHRRIVGIESIVCAGFVVLEFYTSKEELAKSERSKYVLQRWEMRCLVCEDDLDWEILVGDLGLKRMKKDKKKGMILSLATKVLPPHRSAKGLPYPFSLVPSVLTYRRGQRG